MSQRKVWKEISGPKMNEIYVIQLIEECARGADGVLARRSLGAEKITASCYIQEKSSISARILQGKTSTDSMG